MGQNVKLAQRLAGLIEIAKVKFFFYLKHVQRKTIWFDTSKIKN